MMLSLFYIPTRVENEVRRRIRLSLAAYQYEMCSDGKQVMTDEEFDTQCGLVDVSVDTPRKDMDDWFRTHFQPHTGQWIHQHPELSKIEGIYNAHYN